VRVVAETALAGDLYPVVVITGAVHDDIVTALSGLPVEVVENPDWEEGQSTSVRTAVEHLPHTPDAEVMAAVFLLVDQPQIPASLVQALTDLYAKTLAPIIAPLVDDRRGNPVLFDRATFDALQDAVGDAGGRQIFSRFPVKYLTWLDAGARLDVDTAEDYDQLLRLYPD
jgi:molybdenum cofactor cytidylyltransferase